jgi:AI-2 transport system ATP-binding protein
VFISHKLPEIRMLSSHVSVMRDGAVVLSGETAQFDDSALIAAMTPVSREKSLSDTQKLWLALPGNRRTQPQDFPVLRVEDLPGKGLSISALRSTPGRSSAWPGWWAPGAPSLPKPSTACGRCAGARLAGESGHHRRTRKFTSGQRTGLPAGRQAGVWPVPRRADPLEHRGAERAVALAAAQKESAVVERYHRALGIKLNHADQTVRTLSGGNQQKVLLARCLEANPLLLIVDEPTRGVDVSARADIYQLIKSVAAQNVAVLMISSDLDEFPGLADRVLVMHQGVLSGELPRHAVSLDRMMALAFGGQS